MYNITQSLNICINYEGLLTDSIRFKGDNFSKINKILLIICLTTGLDIRLVTDLKWKDILSLDSENDFDVKDQLTLRNYLIPVTPIIKSKLLNIINSLDFKFELEDSIIEQIPEEYKKNIDLLYESIVITLSSKEYYFYNLKLKEEFIKLYDFKTYTQRIFGRKVLEVNGYNNKISKDLKQHFGFKLNSELLNFLGYQSKDEIHFEIHKINLIDGGNIVKLKDKNFNQGYYFQKFNSFLLFLEKINSKEKNINSIKLLLKLSLHLGIRPSSLINLNWEDVLIINEDEKSIAVIDTIYLKKYKLSLSSQIKESLLSFFVFSNDKNNFSAYPIKDNLTILRNKDLLEYKTKPVLNIPIFTMNSGNRITQPSLSREIKKCLNQFGFRHSDKFKSFSTSIMFGRRILEIKGDHKPTIQKLKEHFNFRSEKDLFAFLHIDVETEKGEYKFRDKKRRNMFEEIAYDFEKYNFY
ncbi:hypothetical protein [Flavobacterium sp. NRK F7]|uniref:hypothetical protein n=1 Tax=Flavobacterium sp. NRK F7 TaxID=2954930 RepID=UPI002090C02B|nr:hypothetical protein [Flavobacterium sp. NRK F7]MCO6163950.1 hypothetical protein [Flavobacterium sp. NRK F7]